MHERCPPLFQNFIKIRVVEIGALGIFALKKPVEAGQAGEKIRILPGENVKVLPARGNDQTLILPYIDKLAVNPAARAEQIGVQRVGDDFFHRSFHMENERILPYLTDYIQPYNKNRRESGAA
jgi:hypothetical protein